MIPGALLSARRRRREQDADALKLRLDYLLRMYQYYTAHTNTIFNFYLILVGLLVNAYVLAFRAESGWHPAAAAWIAFAGVVLNRIFFAIDMNSRNLMRRIQNDLRRIEGAIYGGKRGFLTRQAIERRNEKGHGYWFGAVFTVSLILALAGVVVGCLRLAEEDQWVALAILMGASAVVASLHVFWLRRHVPTKLSQQEDDALYENEHDSALRTP